MGLFDNNEKSAMDELFGDFFDLDGDGTTDLAEEFFAYQMFKDCTKSDDDEIEDEFEDNNSYDYVVPVNKYEWREKYEIENYDDNVKYSIFPDEYETEEGYLATLRIEKENQERKEGEEQEKAKQAQAPQDPELQQTIQDIMDYYGEEEGTRIINDVIARNLRLTFEIGEPEDE